jgi:class 3 adenylate cyclase
MNDRINKTSICSIVFLDIIDYSKKSDADQIEVKNQFNDLVNRSLKGVAQNDRIILDTGDGVAIAHMGSPEDAMFVALTIRDGILKINQYSPTPLFVRFGINLGPVRIVTDINGQPNIIGDGINVAQRIMSFAQANQILVSRSYYEVTSRLTVEFSEMFDYSGVKHDKHVREHEVYSVRSHQDTVANASQPMVLNEDRRLTHRLVPKLAITKKVNLKYAALALPALVAFALIIKSAVDTSVPNAAPNQPQITVIPSAVAAASVGSNENGLLLNETVVLKTPNEAQVAADNDAILKLEKGQEIKSAQEALTKAELVKTKLAVKAANRKAKQKENSEMPAEYVQTQVVTQPTIVNKSRVTAKPASNSVKTTELIADKSDAKPKSRWRIFKDNVKNGEKGQCTQAEISMNQCSN